MIITCPDCATAFKVPASVFSSGARKVRCAQCGHSWSQVSPVHEPVQTDLLDDLLSDSQPELPAGEATDADINDFDADMPEFGGFTENDQQRMDAVSDDRSDENKTGESDAGLIPHDIESEARGSNKTVAGTKSSNVSKRRKWAASLGMAACLAMIAGSAIYYRKVVCAYVPALAGVYSAIGLPVNLLGIDFAKVQLKHKYENGFPILSVQGEVVNVSGVMQQIPDVRLGLSAPGGYEIYHWSINIGQSTLGPDERVKFVTRLASPPEEASKITIKFKKPRDRQMGAL